MTDLSAVFDLIYDIVPADVVDDVNMTDALHFALTERLITADDVACVSHFFDARRLPCPMPLLKAKVTLRDVGVGRGLYLLATDKNSQTDLVAYCQKNGLTVKTWAYGQTDTIFHFLIRAC
ncbi:sulfurtransferase TusA family protein [Moraxella bovis]|uniref:SirA-like protein n=1 Tax=Moraxella bovis TaxID=476 RepID=A0A378PX32_MORBO|nr:sulfurtransferase TusA family protein [Moraxella bovis]STY91302.1 SirA-like protein [Moraxella bovis]